MQQDIIEKYKDHQVDEKTQKRLNEPLEDETGVSDEYKNFLKSLIEKLESGQLDPHNPETLYNHEIYDKLSESDQEATSLTAINLMSMIRQIQQLHEIDATSTFQIQNLVDTVFQMKSKFEEKYGDVYII